MSMSRAGTSADLRAVFEAQRAAMIEMLAQSIRIDSVTGNEGACGEFFAARLE